MEPIIKGDIYFAHLPLYINELENPNVQQGDRYVVVVSRDKSNYYGSLVTVIPITTKCKIDDMYVRIGGLRKESFAICDQTILLNKKNLIEYIKPCDEAELRNIDKALDIHFQRDFTRNDKKVQRKAKVKAESIIKLERFIRQYKDLVDIKELEKNLLIQISELNEYCRINRLDLEDYYKPIM